MTTTWNTLDNSDATLSGSPLLVASFQTTHSTWHCVRSTNMPAKTTGKYHFEATITATDGNDGWMIGAGNGSATLTNYTGSDGNSFGVQAETTSGVLNVYINGLVAADQFTLLSHVGDVIAVEVDIGGALVWAKNVTQATGWTNGDGSNSLTGNPGAGTGGISISPINMTGGLMIMFAGFFGTAADTVTLNPGPNFAGVVSAGFSSWDATPATQQFYIETWS